MARRNAPQGAHFAQPSPIPQPKQPRHPRRKSKGPLVVISILVLAALGAGAYLLITHLPVSVTVDGQQRTVFKNTTVDDLFNSEHPSVTPGNYVAVTGQVLKAAQGDPYSATVNGTTLSYAEAKSRTLSGNEAISFGNGADVMEEHTTEMVDEQPKLEYRVAPGTPEKGDQVQQGTIQYVLQWGKAGRREILHGTESGETGTGSTDEGAKNCIIQAQSINPDDGQKLVALTFDDGPTYFTQPYLDILAEKDVKATFCIIGEQVADGSYVIGETAKAGHQIASHTWDHRQLTTLDEDEVRFEVGDTAAALKDVVGHDVTYVRPPYGDIDPEVWLKSGGAMGFSMYWTHDSRDWETPGVDAIVANCTTNMAPGSVILMHDGGGERSQDVEALPRIIDAWKEAGYTFVTMEELLRSDSSIPREVLDSAGIMPNDAVWPTELA